MSSHDDQATRAKRAFDAFARARERVDIASIDLQSARVNYELACKELASARSVLLVLLSPDMLSGLTSDIKADVVAHNPDPTSSD